MAGDDYSSERKLELGKNKVPIITVKGLHQLHILIFFLAVLHVAYSAITMALGRLKTRGWKQWEEETSSHDFEFSNDPSRFRLTHETSFVRVHTSFWTRVPIFFYIMGSNMKKSIFDEQTARALQNWRMAVKRKHEGKGGNSPNRSVGNSPTASPVHSTPSSPFFPTTAATFHRSKTTGQPTRFAAYEDTNASDFKAEPLSHESSTRHLTDQTIACRNDHEIKLDLLTQPEVETRKQDLGRH